MIDGAKADSKGGVMVSLSNLALLCLVPKVVRCIAFYLALCSNGV